MTNPQGFASRELELEPDWIDYNGHLNMAYYNVLFDRGLDDLFAHIGLGPDYAETRRLTTYTAESHTRYLREIHLGDIVTVHTQLLDHDAKRLHTFSTLVHSEGWISATAETMTLHVDMSGPKVTAFPDDITANLAKLADEQSALPAPEGAGRPIAIRRK